MNPVDQAPDRPASAARFASLASHSVFKPPIGPVADAAPIEASRTDDRASPDRGL